MTSGVISLSTNRTMEFVDISSLIQKAVSQSGITDGICQVYNPHTTAGLTINEGADPAVRDDILAAFKKIVPFDHPFRHLEGNSPAHILTTMTGSSVSVFIENGSLKLGTWQRIFFTEYDGPRNRKVWWKIISD